MNSLEEFNSYRDAVRSISSWIRLGKDWRPNFSALPVKPQQTYFKDCFRYIALSSDLHDYYTGDIHNPEKRTPAKLSQLNWDMIEQPYTSWAKERSGAERFAACHSHGYFILIQADITGFNLIDYLDKLVEELSCWIKSNTAKLAEWDLTEAECLSEIHYKMRDIPQFSEEQEIICTQVHNFKIMESKTLGSLEK